MVFIILSLGSRVDLIISPTITHFMDSCPVMGILLVNITMHLASNQVIMPAPEATIFILETALVTDLATEIQEAIMYS